MTTFDDVLEVVGPWGRYQILHFVLIGLMTLTGGLNNMANVFLVGVSEFWCHVPELANLSAVDRHQWMSLENNSVIPDDSCTLYELNYTEAAWAYVNNATISVQNSPLEQCSQWVYDKEMFGETIAQKWDLVCSQSWKRALASSIYMLGFLLGCIVFGTMADRYGRKLALLVGLVLMMTSGVGASFAPEYWSHNLFRMVTGSATAAVYTCGFVLVVESIGVRQRMVPAVLIQAWFAGGYILLVGFAYAFKDYKWLCLFLAVSPIALFPIWWFVGESPRWLISRSRLKEAQEELNRISRMNGSTINNIQTLQLGSLCQEVNETGRERAQQPGKYTIIDLLRTPNMRKKSLNLFFNWFVITMVYYGLSMSSGDLAGGPYLNLFISGVVDIMSMVAACFMLNRLGRRWSHAGMMIMAGVACLTIITIPAQQTVIITVLAMLGKLGVSGGFSIIYVYTAELYPTVVRSIGVGSGSMCARVGGLLAPFVADLGKVAWKPLPMIIFGGFSVAAGLLALLLPETLNKTLPETLEQGEQFGKGRRSCLPKKRTTKTLQLDDQATGAGNPQYETGLI